MNAAIGNTPIVTRNFYLDANPVLEGYIDPENPGEILPFVEGEITGGKYVPIKNGIQVVGKIHVADDVIDDTGIWSIPYADPVVLSVDQDGIISVPNVDAVDPLYKVRLVSKYNNVFSSTGVGGNEWATSFFMHDLRRIAYGNGRFVIGGTHHSGHPHHQQTAMTMLALDENDNSEWTMHLHPGVPPATLAMRIMFDPYRNIFVIPGGITIRISEDAVSFREHTSVIGVQHLYGFRDDGLIIGRGFDSSVVPRRTHFVTGHSWNSLVLRGPASRNGFYPHLGVVGNVFIYIQTRNVWPNQSFQIGYSMDCETWVTRTLLNTTGQVVNITEALWLPTHTVFISEQGDVVITCKRDAHIHFSNINEAIEHITWTISDSNMYQYLIPTGQEGLYHRVTVSKISGAAIMVPSAVSNRNMGVISRNLFQTVTPFDIPRGRYWSIVSGNGKYMITGSDNQLPNRPWDFIATLKS